MEKRGLVLAYFAICLFYFIGNLYALGVSPAGRDYNFNSGLEGSVRYYVWQDDQDAELNISLKGDLAEYVNLDKTTVKGSGEFTASFKLPDKIEVPGRHRVEVIIAEKIDEEVAAQFIGTTVTVISVIDVYVPYPGRFLELSLSGDDVNSGEPVVFSLGIVSKGTELVTISPKIEVFSSKGQLVDTLQFNQRDIPSQESIVLSKVLETANLNPGKYKAIASVDYGDRATAETNFRIGSLSINILSYTNRIPIGKLEKFDVEIESGWNDYIEGAYADVVILNGTRQLTSFKTTSNNLVPWENKTITGYIDTSTFNPGIYDVNITVIYYGKEQGKSSNVLVKVEFFKGKSLLLWYIIGGIGLGIIVTLVLIRYFMGKNGRNEPFKKRFPKTK